MGYCKNECPDGETTCCICCDKQGGCDNRCDMMDSYEYAEDCEDYVMTAKMQTIFCPAHRFCVPNVRNGFMLPAKCR